MAYYNRDLKRLKIKRKKLEWLNQGNCAKVFRYGDKVLKEYFPDTGRGSRLKPEVFDILRHIDNDNFMKLYEIYSDMDFFEMLIYLVEKNLYKEEDDCDIFQVDCSLAKYYPSDPIHILEESINYVLENFRQLDSLFDIFTDNGIRTDDIKRENCVLNTNGIVIIDPDCFKISKDSIRDVRIHNKKNLLHLLKSICCDNVGDYKNFGKIKDNINGFLDEADIKENTDIAYEISNKLKYVKKPIDYFRKYK